MRTGHGFFLRLYTASFLLDCKYGSRKQNWATAPQPVCLSSVVYRKHETSTQPSSDSHDGQDSASKTFKVPLGFKTLLSPGCFESSVLSMQVCAYSHSMPREHAANRKPQLRVQPCLLFQIKVQGCPQAHVSQTASFFLTRQTTFFTL